MWGGLYDDLGFLFVLVVVVMLVVVVVLVVVVRWKCLKLVAFVVSENVGLPSVGIAP